ncbi:hypothetical protein [Cohnella hongkongensis]|uniref:Uncharacterized protein n=1 Tax=Cohnella hongkongensis TaxID=178337 RepID=A0ABV9FG87_9BACL
MKYQVIEIVNQEPLKIGAGGNKTSTTEPCKDYIPGSTIRGGIIGQMLKMGICDDQTIGSILNRMLCYNAYPFHPEQKRLYIPAPQHLRLDKHEFRERRMKLDRNRNRDDFADDELIHMLDLSVDSGSTARNILPFRFVSIQDEAMEGFKVTKSYQLHHSHSLNRDKKEKENLFSYQAIQPGHVFRAIVLYDEEVESQVDQALNRTTQLYLGGSKGSGYGLCTISTIKDAVSNYREAQERLKLRTRIAVGDGDKLSNPPGERLVITCLSDCLFRNEQGQPINEIPARLFNELSDEPVHLSLVAQYVQTGLSEGFNAKWHARYPKEATLKAGSILIYTFTSEVSTEAKLKIIEGLEEQPRGYRRQDGYGWLAVNVDYPNKMKAIEAINQIIRVSDAGKKTASGHATALARVKQDPNANVVLNMIQRGLRETREKWLQVICDRSWQSAADDRDGSALVIAESLKSHHYENMRKIVEDWLANREQEKRARLTTRLHGRDYEEDNQKCSIAGCNFKSIIQYMDGQGENAALSNYARKMLNSSSGSLYYGDPEDPGNQKQFIAELLSEGLYSRVRRKLS